MNTEMTSRRDYNFLKGLLAGTVVGAGLAIWFAPRLASELRQRATDAARDLKDRASDRYEQASARVGETVNDLTRTGQRVRDDMADAVVRGAQEVERIATAAKTDPLHGTNVPPTSHTPPATPRAV
jgi:gas vesicle protein